MKIYSDYNQAPITPGKLDAGQLRCVSSDFKNAMRFRVSSKEFSGSFFLKNGNVIAQRGITAEQAQEAADVVMDISSDNFRQLAMKNYDVLGDDRLVNIGEFDGEDVVMDLSVLKDDALLAILSLDDNSLHIQEDGVWLETSEAKTFVSHQEDIDLSLSRMVGDNRMSQEDAVALKSAYDYAIQEYVEQSGLDRDEEPSPSP